MFSQRTGHAEPDPQREHAVPTENSVRINPHPCGTLIADLESMRFSCWKHIGV